jgi:transcription initiation factor TFIID TATA-box-binding protein
MSESTNGSTVNVVASSSIGCEVDLDQLSEDMSPVSYNPEDFPGLVYRMNEPDVSTLLFHSGKIVATGADAVEEAEDAIHSVFTTLDDLGVPVDDNYDVDIENIVTSAEIGHRLNLNAVAIGLGVEVVEYEPEQFPGLIYRVDDPDVCVLLFGSGQVVVSGGNEEGEAEEAIDIVENELDSLGLLD